jgi:hypothetical protein
MKHKRYFHSSQLQTLMYIYYSVYLYFKSKKHKNYKVQLNEMAVNSTRCPITTWYSVTKKKLFYKASIREYIINR